MELFKGINISKWISAKKMVYVPPPIPEAVWHDPLYFIAFGFGTGAMPWAPGTFGTLVGVCFYLLLSALPSKLYIVCVILLTLVSVWICQKVDKKIGVHDHPGMNLDEVIGFLVTMILVPSHWLWIILGFILFRFFDIVKPWPIRWLDEKVPGGWGIMLDDVVAGIFSCVVLKIIILIT